MTNREKYADEIIDIAIKRNRFAVNKQGKAVDCEEINCQDCILNKPGGNCSFFAKEWSEQEYVEPPVDWSKVAVDTPILVSRDNEKWYKRHFAECKNGTVYAWNDGRTSWSEEQNICEWEYAKLAEQEDK